MGTKSTHVLTDGRWREVELFLPADLNLSEVTDYLDSAILLNASEAGEFVARLSVGTRMVRSAAGVTGEPTICRNPLDFWAVAADPLVLADSTLALMVTRTDIDFQFTLRKLLAHAGQSLPAGPPAESPGGHGRLQGRAQSPAPRLSVGLPDPGWNTLTAAANHHPVACDIP